MQKFLMALLVAAVGVGGFYYYQNMMAPEVSMPPAPIPEQVPTSTPEIPPTESLEQQTAHDPETPRPDLAKVVGESILGTWQSIDDKKYVREFRKNNVLIDYYDKVQDRDTEWYAFTSETQLHTEVPYPLQENTVYILIATDHEALFFEVVKVTPEELELIFLNRGGALRFTRVE